MKICLYSPYLPDHTGGGEKYLFDVADVLSKNHQVVIAINKPLSESDINGIREKYQTFLNRSLDKIEFISTPLGTSASFFHKLWWTSRFDRLYYVTDGSLFFSLAGKNILHIQVPLKLDKSRWLEQLKLKNWQFKNTNSEFTKSIVEKAWPVAIDVVHQPLIELTETVVDLKTTKKEHIILSVGRFFTQLHSKRQEVLVEMFKELVQKYPSETKSWKLVLIGSVEDQAYAEKISQAAQGFPIEIYHQVDRSTLVEWYERASIYWHAAGYEIDEQAHPEKVEHFGMSTAEAMLAGCAPVVIGKGGQKEILGSELQEWLWQSAAECIEKTLTLIQNKPTRSQVQLQAQERAQLFGRTVFAKKVNEMIK